MGCTIDDADDASNSVYIFKIQEGIQGQVGILSQPPDYISNP